MENNDLPSLPLLPEPPKNSFAIPKEDERYYIDPQALNRIAQTIETAQLYQSDQPLIIEFQTRMRNLLEHGKASQDKTQDYSDRYEHWVLYCQERKALTKLMLDAWHKENEMLKIYKQQAAYYRGFANMAKNLEMLDQPRKNEKSKQFSSFKELW